jgi:hypothetical protein
MTNKAILIGINYIGQKGELKGCINDVKAIYNHLITNAGFNPQDIKILTEISDIKPTTSNIIMNLYELVMETNKPDANIDSLFIHYSGHGTYVRDKGGDENDGNDEAICPVDYGTAGVITDDLLKHVLSNVNPNTKVTAVFDCCHSQSILDLRYRYTVSNINFAENTIDKSKSIEATIIMISGCMDIQTSADAWNINDSNKWSGALTSNLLEVLKESKYNITCRNLLINLTKKIKDQGYTQIPQMTCSKKLNDTDIFSCTSSPKIFLNNDSKKRKCISTDSNIYELSSDILGC